MPSMSSSMPQLDGGLFLTDGGIETSLIFHDGLELPLFAAFVLFADEAGTAALRRYYRPYLALAREAATGFVFESPTWRASRDWGERLGYSAAALAAANRRAMQLGAELRRQAPGTRVVLSGCIGPRGDGYRPEALMDGAEAADYHAAQAKALAEGGAELVTAITMTHSGEAIGVVRAAEAAGLSAVISFTVETDGRLPTGQSLGEAIAEVDAATGAAPAYYMLNCAHPAHFVDVLRAAGPWAQRLRGIRANASCRSHAELDAAADLDDGDPAELAAQYAELRRMLPRLVVLGGCCGTDQRHLYAIARACGCLSAA